MLEAIPCLDVSCGWAYFSWHYFVKSEDGGHLFGTPLYCTYTPCYMERTNVRLE